jgi:hypothetical protein
MLYSRAQTVRAPVQVHEWLGRRNLPQPIKDMILAYYGEVWVHHRGHPTEAKIWSELPSKLTAHIAKHLTKKLLAQLPLFDGTDEGLRERISARLTPLEVAPGETEGCLW